MALTEAADLLHKKIVTKSGKELGHVFNVRFAHTQTKHSSFGSLIITHLLYGRKGFLQRLGIRQPDAKEIAWKYVVKLEKDSIVVKTER